MGSMRIAAMLIAIGLFWSVALGVQTTAAPASERKGGAVPYKQMSEQELNDFISKLKKIKLGDNINKIDSFLGKPDFNGPIPTKNPNIIVGIQRKYYIEKILEKQENDSDIVVTLYFYNSDNLGAINSNIPSYTRNEISNENLGKIERKERNHHRVCLFGFCWDL